MNSSRFHKVYQFQDLEAQTNCKYSQLKILKSSFNQRAAVIKCNDDTNNRKLVVRVVLLVTEDDISGDDDTEMEHYEQIEIFNRERSAARVVSSLKHQHIVEILGFYEGECYFYTVMPFYEHGDLEQLSKNYNLSESTIAMIAYQLAKALLTLHCYENAKVVHRDIALDNIFVEEYDEKTGNVKVRLADFELCEVVEVSRITCTMIGRLKNNPPINEVGSSLDIWCLGIIIYRLLSGDKTTDFHKGFKSQSEIDKFIMHSDVINKKLAGSDLKCAILACLQIDKEQRVTSRILMEYLLRIILIEKKFDEHSNPNLRALDLMYNAIDFMEAQKILNEQTNITFEEKELIPVFNILAENSTYDLVNSIQDKSDSFLIPFIKALTFGRMNFFLDSIKYFTDLINKFPYFVNIFNARGNTYFNMKEYSKALEDQSMAIQFNPYKDRYYYDRARIYREMKEYPKAIEDNSIAIDLNPFDDNNYNSRAFTYDIQKEYVKAIEDYTIAIELNPKALYFHNRAISYRNMEEYEKSIADYTIAIELNPKDLYFHNRGDLYRNMEEYEKSIEDYTMAINLNPFDSSHYNNRGFTYDIQKEYEKSIEDYTIAIELNPKALYFHNRAISYRNMEEYEKSIEDYTMAINLNPFDSSHYNNRGFTYDIQKEYEKAIDDYTIAIELNPKDLYFHNRGDLYRNMEEYEKSIEDYTMAIYLNPFDSSHYNNRGFTYDIQKEYEKAIDDYTIAIELNPKALYFHNRAISYRFLKEYSKALEDHCMAIELNCLDSSFFNARGDTYEEMKEYSLAMKDYLQVTTLDPDYYKTKLQV